MLVLAFILACESNPPANPQPGASPTPAAATASGSPGAAAAPSTPDAAAQTPAQVASQATPPPPSAPETPAPPRLEPTPPRTFTIKSGTTISITTDRELSTKTSKTGDTFAGSLNNAIVDGDWVIARKGATVQGVVSDSDPGGKVKGVASISLSLRQLQLADGRSVAIGSSTYAKEAKSTKKKDAAKIGIGAGVGTAIGAIAGGGKGAAIGAAVGGGAGTGAVLLTRGDSAVVPAESTVSFRLTTPVKVVKH